MSARHWRMKWGVELREDGWKNLKRHSQMHAIFTYLSACQPFKIETHIKKYMLCQEKKKKKYMLCQKPGHTLISNFMKHSVSGNNTYPYHMSNPQLFFSFILKCLFWLRNLFSWSHWCSEGIMTCSLETRYLYGGLVWLRCERWLLVIVLVPKCLWFSFP